MGYIKDPKSVGGMINSIGFSEQDCASVKYMFDYLENGLREISFESENDFCIVLNNEKRLYVQVKINQFTLKFISKLLKDSDIKGKTVFVGTGYDDAFRNLLQYKARYLEARDGILYEDKEELLSEIETCCNGSKIDMNVFLQCDFMILDSINREDIAKSAIDKWARNKSIFIDTNALFNELVALISNRLRTFGGHLSKKDIIEIIKKHRTSKIGSFIPKEKRISSIVEKTCKNDIAEYIDNLMVRYDVIKDKLLFIKYYLENDQLIEAKNEIEKIVNICCELKGILLMVLNILGDYDAVIERECLQEKEAIDCIVEYAKAYMHKGKFEISQKYLEAIDEKDWDFVVFYVSAVNHQGLGEEEKARSELEKCIELNDKFVDAYVFLASLIYISNTELATKYLDIALSLEPKYAKAYMLRAQISQLSDDFACVIENYEKYIAYSEDDENESVLLNLAINKFHIESDDWQVAFQKWNEAFRKKQNVVGEVIIPVVDLGKDYSYIFILQSLEDGLNVFLGEQEIFSYRRGKTMARTAIGLYASPLEMNMLSFTLQNVENPIRRSEKSIFDEMALPAIIKYYDEFESYQDTLNSLLEQNILHINHIFGENVNEYMVDSEDINVKMEVVGKKLIGNAIIGEVDLNIEINPLSNSLDRFIKQLNKNCGFNEATIILVYDENHQTQLTFPKQKMKLSIID